MEANKIKANKNANYEIKECDKEFYHILCTRKFYDRNKNDMATHSFIQSFDGKGFADFKKNKHTLGLASDEVIHIPEKMAKEEVKKPSTNKKENKK